MKRSVVTMVGLALAAASSASAARPPLRIRTATLPHESGSYLYCKVVATSVTPIAIVATVLSGDGTDVTEFGSGFRSSPTDDGLFHAEETAGSLNADARNCVATITGARKRDVHVTLTAFDAAGNAIATVEAP